MIVFYLIAAFAAGSEFVATLSGDMSPYLYAVMSAMNFAVGVTIVYSGVRMILGDLIPAFQGIATKIIPNAIPAVDCAVFFTYAPTAVVLRSEERRVGKECRIGCRSRWSPYH